ncbi:MAG: CD225/dispanin family protein [Saprospiraceae bacterium]
MRTQPPKNWLVESILVTICCCLPFGIVGIVNASKVESKFYAGDIDGAERAAAEAKKWTVIGFWIGIAVIVLYLIFVGVAFFMAIKNGALDEQ